MDHLYLKWAEVKSHNNIYWAVNLPTYLWLCCGVPSGISGIYISSASRIVLTEQRIIETQTASEPRNTQNLMEISVIHLNVCQPQNVSSVHQEEEQRERRSEGKGKKLFWCKTTLVFSPLLPVPHIKSKKSLVQTHEPLRQLTPFSLHSLQVTRHHRISQPQKSVSNEQLDWNQCVIFLTYLTV